MTIEHDGYEGRMMGSKDLYDGIATHPDLLRRMFLKSAPQSQLPQVADEMNPVSEVIPSAIDHDHGTTKVVVFQAVTAAL